MTDVRMRVLLDCRMATWTGVGRYTVGLARALARRDDLELVQVAASDSVAPAAGLHVRAVNARAGAFSPAGMVEMARIIAAEKPDITHALHFPVPAPAPRPLVVTMHDLSPLVVEGLMPSAARRAAYRLLTGRAIGMAQRIICDSSCTRDDVERYFPAATGKTRVVLLAADDFSAGPKEPLTGHLEQLAMRPYVLSMGSTRRHKDLPTLLAAFSAVADRFPDIRLLLVGPSDPAYLEAHLHGQPAELRERIAFTGRVPDEQLRTLFWRARLFVFPSLYEGFGLPPLEAMSLGTPTIVSDAASLPEVVADGALMFPAGDPQALAGLLGEVLASDGQRGRMREAGTRRAKELTWEHTAEQTVEVYREALGR